MNEEIKAIIPKQYIGRWKNEEGESLKIFFYLDTETNELKKMFMPVADFMSFELKTFLGKNVILEMSEDDEGRPSIAGITENN